MGVLRLKDHVGVRTRGKGGEMMNIGTARNLMLDQKRHSEFWETQVERHRKEGSDKKVEFALRLALAHREIAEIYWDWMEYKKREER